MHPEVDIVRTRLLAVSSVTGEIHASSPAARNLCREVSMRIPILAMLALAACVDVPHRHYFNGDGGVDGGSAARSCSNAQLVAGDMSFTYADNALLLSGVPKSGSWKLGGKLTLSGSGVTSLAKLGDLCSVGDLEIGNTGLAKVDTAGAIEVVGNLSIHDNSSLTDVTNVVPGADRVSSIFVENNAKLARFDSYAPLQYVTNKVTVDYNNALTSIDLGSVIRIEGGVDVSYDSALTSLKLTALQSVTGDVTISHDTALPGVTLGELQYVHGTLTIDSNDAIDLASMMSSPLQRIDYNLYITNNAKLTGVGQLAHTGSIGGVISISNNAALDFCPAREVGCCVAHAGVASITNNLTSQCNTGHSWCFANNTCPYQYSN